MNWQINIQPTPKSKETDRARIFLEMTRVQPSPEPVLEDIDQYLANLAGLGDSISSSEEAALRTYKSSLVTAGVWEKLELLMPFLGSTAAGQALALRTPVSQQPDNRGFLNTDVVGNSLSNFSDQAKHINTRVTLNDLASQTDLTISIAVEDTIGGTWAGIFNDDINGDDAFFNIGYGPFDGIFFFADTTYVGYFGDPVLNVSADFIADTNTPGDGSWTGLFTGIKPTDSTDVQFYYAANFFDSITPSNPAVTAPVGLSPTPVVPPELHVFGMSGAGNSDNHNEITDLRVSWLVAGSNWTEAERDAYLTATQILFITLSKTFETFGGGGGD